jgi:hypothetical protein
MKQDKRPGRAQHPNAPALMCSAAHSTRSHFPNTRAS